MNLFDTCRIKILPVLKAACAVKHATCNSSLIPDNILGLQFKKFWKSKVQLEQALKADNVLQS